MGMSRSFLVAFLGVLVLAVPIQAQDQSGFISIDCGAPDENYTESGTGLNYTSDANLIHTGVSGTIASELKNEFQIQMWNVRSFPEGKRNCYKINITRASKYLIRVSFLYGNYNGQNMLPEFDIFLGANRWFTMTIHNATVSKSNEIIHVPSQDYDNSDWTQLSASIPADSLDQGIYNRPAIVMSTAVTPVNASAPLVISWEPVDETELFYVYMHFTETQVLGKNQTREFNIIENGESGYEKFSPQYLSVDTINSMSAISGKEIKYSLEKTKNSTLPPIINAIEIYRVIDFQQSDTYQGDVDAITTIKSVYGVTRDWQGDPCAPVVYLWDGLNCTYPGKESPRITSL